MTNSSARRRGGIVALVVTLATAGLAALVAASGAAAALVQGAAAPRSALRPTPVLASPAAPAPDAAADLVGSTDFGRPDFARTLWWHHRRNTARFQITASQIAALDRLLAPRLAEFERLAIANEKELRRYLAAIAGAKWDEAHAAATARADAFGKLQGAQLALQIEGLKLLDTAQRARMTSEIPRLVQTGWVRASALASGASAGSSAPAPAAKPHEIP